jgi:hypothetical protein
LIEAIEAGVADDAEGEQDGLGPAGRDDNVIGGERDVIPAEVIGDGLTQLEEPLGRTVGQDGIFEIAEGVEDRLRGGDIGVTYVQEMDLYTPLDGVVGIGFELPDGRGLDGASSVGDIHL